MILQQLSRFYLLKLKKGEKMSNKDAHWAKTKGHMYVTLVLWFFFSIVLFMFGTELNTLSFLGYPLAYYMTAQGSLLAFVIILFWTANKQEKIDEEHGFSEREDD
jgi:putative solute:sodium symporter small subunit